LTEPPASGQDATPPSPAEPGIGAGAPRPDAGEARPLVERIGLGAIALVLAGVFGAVAAAALASGEVFLGTMAGIGALMTLWAAASTLRR
jgi:hypothetical protein